MKTKIQIKSVFGKVIFEFEKENNTFRDTVSEAIKSSADLSPADLRYADLGSADLSYADLGSADLSYADLRSANLSYADLRSADLSYADLSYVALLSADLRSADLRDADLRYADLRYADLSYVALRSANLRSANLRYANLSSANLSYADLRSAKNSELAIAQTRILPEGALIGWKKCRNDIIVKLQIPAEAKRSNALGRKCRAEFVKTLEIFGAKKGVSPYDNKTEYVKGKITKCNGWDEDFTNECSAGIHFFITRLEAENY